MPTPGATDFNHMLAAEEKYRLKLLVTSEKTPDDINFLSFAEQYCRGPIATYDKLANKWGYWS